MPRTEVKEVGMTLTVSFVDCIALSAFQKPDSNTSEQYGNHEDQVGLQQFSISRNVSGVDVTEDRKEFPSEALSHHLPCDQ
jgi:hypothetical protein